jgi:exonuclease III
VDIARTLNDKVRACLSGFITHADWVQEQQQRGTGDAEAQRWRRVRDALRITNANIGKLIWKPDQHHIPAHVEQQEKLDSVFLCNVDGLRGSIVEVLDILRARKPAVAVLLELKMAPAQIQVIGPDGDLKSTLSALGYKWCFATTCTLDSIGPSNWGSMIISRVEPSSFELGLQDPELDAEGRVVILRFHDRKTTVIGDYTPCSKVGTVPTRRKRHDEKLQQAILREQSYAGGDTKVIYVGDRNVAPSPEDANTSNMMDRTVRMSQMSVLSKIPEKKCPKFKKMSKNKNKMSKNKTNCTIFR